MPETRRKVLATLIGSLAAGPLLRAQLTRNPTPLPSPNAPDPHVPSGLNGPQPTKGDTPTFNPQNQRDIREDVDKLYQMITELKKQVDATDLNSTLPLSVVKKAQQIEKLAKQVKEKAKG